MEFLTTPMEYWGENQQFVHHYFCHSFSTIRQTKLNEGNKILMPASALDCLSALRIDDPMMFSIQNTYDDCGRASHCGVLEFTAEEGFVFLPQWMMDNLKILEGDLVLLKNVSLPKGTYVKLQPHTTDFINISDPKAVLEKALKKFACLTTGDTITISHNQKKFSIDVVETKPNSAISIIDTDCEVDFAAPLDYIEPEKKGSHVANKIGNSKEGKDKQKYVAFSGLARRLDGAVPAVSDAVVEKMETDEISGKTSSKTCGCQEPGSMVFGRSSIVNKRSPKKDEKEEHACKKEETKFEPFTGRKSVIGFR